MTIRRLGVGETSPGSNLGAGWSLSLVDPYIELPAGRVGKTGDRLRQFPRRDVLRLQIVEVALGKSEYQVALLRRKIRFGDHLCIVAMARNSQRRFLPTFLSRQNTRTLITAALPPYIARANPMATLARRFDPLQVPLLRPEAHPKPTLVPPPPPVEPGQRAEVMQLRASLAPEVAGKITNGAELVRAIARRRRETILPTTIEPLDAL